MCHCLDKYFRTAETQVYVLLDFCNLQKVTKEVFNMLMQIASNCLLFVIIYFETAVLINAHYELHIYSEAI